MMLKLGKDEGQADFFAVTDHSNWFDNELANENITDISQSTSKMEATKSKAMNIIRGEYVALAGLK